MGAIKENLFRVNEKIEQACQKAGRKREEITLIAVSKTFEASSIAEALMDGQTIFGENKIQECEEKRLALEGSKWELHLIGHLQSNKVNKGVMYCDFIHSVDSLSLAQKINQACLSQNKKMPILIQVNTSEEGQKSGFSCNDGLLQEAIKQIKDLPQIQLMGLMTIGPEDFEEKKTRTCFQKLRSMKEELIHSTGMKLPHLSMGMSHDFVWAIEEGSTMLRIGSSIFGKRTYTA